MAVDKTSLDYTQEGIESWAARELLLSNAQSSQEPSPPTNLTHGNSAESIGGKLCYGMVCDIVSLDLRSHSIPETLTTRLDLSRSH